VCAFSELRFLLAGLDCGFYERSANRAFAEEAHTHGSARPLWPHKQIVTRILSDLNQIKSGNALKVPLGELAESKAKVRSALNRATRKVGLDIATATDADFLYVWRKSDQ
jgi:hypothetical protein